MRVLAIALVRRPGSLLDRQHKKRRPFQLLSHHPEVRQPFAHRPQDLPHPEISLQLLHRKAFSPLDIPPHLQGHPDLMFLARLFPLPAPEVMFLLEAEGLLHVEDGAAGGPSQHVNCPEHQSLLQFHLWVLVVSQLALELRVRRRQVLHLPWHPSPSTHPLDQQRTHTALLPGQHLPRA